MEEKNILFQKKR